MQATMIKVEMSPKMEKAIARCKQHHPRVRRVDASTVRVFGNGGAYTVRFAESKPGLKLASCDCKAGREGVLCYHVPAALACPVPVAPASSIPTPPTAPAVATLPATSACAPTTSRIVRGFYVCPRTGQRIPSVKVDGWEV